MKQLIIGGIIAAAFPLATLATLLACLHIDTLEVAG